MDELTPEQREQILREQLEREQVLIQQLERDRTRREQLEQRNNDGDTRQVGIANTSMGMLPVNTLNAASIQKLNGKNYLPWKRQVTIILKLRGLEQAIRDEGVPEVMDLQATLLLLEAMDDSHKLQVQAEPTAKAIIANLDRQYANRSHATKHRLLSEFMLCKKDPSDTLNQHVGKLKEMRAALINLGERHTEEFFQVVLINSLTAEYGNFMEHWELMHPQMKTTEVLINVFSQKEASSKTEPTALFSQTRKWDTLSLEEKMKITKCRVCHQRGHWARDCPQNKKEHSKIAIEGETGSNDNHSCTVTKEEFAMNMTQVNQDKDLDQAWVADSGATSHMSRNRTWFWDFENASGSVSTGDGTRLKLAGKGSIRITTSIDGVKRDGALTNVLYVPELTTNLVSIGAAADTGVKTIFEGKKCTMEKGQKVIANGTRINDRLYLMDIGTKTRTEEKSMISVRNDTLLEYHRALGHANIDRIRTLLKQIGKEVPAGEKIECPDCPAGKGKHVPHPRIGSRSTEPGELHLDLAAVNKASLEGYKYYLVCKDNFTEYVFIYPCRDKASVPTMTARLIIDFEVASGQRVREIHSDNGSEFVNEATRILFLKEKITHKTSAPYCPQQNGMAEREIQTVTNMARTMLNSSKLGIGLWAAAVECAVYIKNRLPTSRSEVTPFERITGRQPTIDHLVEFGCPVHAIVNGDYLRKFDGRTDEGFIVGFTTRRNTYKVYIPRKEKIIETCDLIFMRHKEGKADAEQEEGQELVKVQLDMMPETTQQSSSGSSENIEAVENHRHDTPTTSTPIGKNGKPYIRSDQLSRFFDNFREENQASSPDNSETSNYRTTVSSGESKAAREPPRGYVQTDLDADLGEDTEDVKQPSSTLTNFNVHSERILLLASKIKEPNNYRQALTGPNHENWKEAIRNELEAHTKNGTWSTVERPSKGVALSTKWVFSLKTDVSGNIERFKARLVARGFEQRLGIDYFGTYAPVAQIESVRTIIAISALKQWDLVQFDVSTAFLNGTVEEDVYIEPPEGVEIPKNQCLKLNKAL